MTGQTRVSVIGICGITCSGKTSLAKMLLEHYKNQTRPSRSGDNCKMNAELIVMDGYFRLENDPNHVLIQELNHINWELMTSLDIDKMVGDVNSSIQRLEGTNGDSLLILEGFLLLNCERLKSLCHLKFFIDLNKDTCFSRRSSRVYDPPDVPGYFEKIVWPESQKNRELVVKSTPDLILLDGSLPLQKTFQKVKEFVDCNLFN